MSFIPPMLATRLEDPAPARGPGLQRRAQARRLCLRLQRGCGVRGWRRDGLGTGARGKCARARRALMSASLACRASW
jgi:hypothetical protein